MTLLQPLPRRLRLAALAAISLSLALPAMAAERLEVGNRVTEGVPELPADLIERLDRYQNTRPASFAGWASDGELLISTRFGETNQVHRVRAPLGMREQLSFQKEPVSSVRAQPGSNGRGFVFGKDVGGSEFWQLYHYDLETRSTRLLTDGGRSRNEQPIWSPDGRLLAWSSTARNGRDSDIWVRSLDGDARAVLTEGGNWYANDFSADGKRLLVQRYISINESQPGEVDLATGKLERFPVEGGKAAFGGLRYAPDGEGIYFISDENSEFRRLRYHRPGQPVQVLTADLDWNVVAFDIASDGRHLAYASNEDGIFRLHVLSLPDHRPVPLPELPVGVIGGMGFSPDGQRIALTLNSAVTPSDVYVVDLAARSLTRWTEGEVGGLDASRFVAPTLIRYESFDGLSIPAFYYRPAGVPAERKLPVVINIHGGPEAQALPVFSPAIQFMLDELQVAVLVPNVRGSAGYGKTYLDLDNGIKRKDSVKDIGALLDWIAQQPGLDADKVGVSGGSYGGYMVLATLVDYADRLAAGINVVGISHFSTFLKNTESYRRDLRRAEYGDERDPEIATFFEEIAPLNNAEKIRSPLFVAQGANDPRVPLSEADQIVDAVQGNGGDVWYLVFKDEGHGFAKKTNADYFSAASMLFWQKHLLGE
ncbi:S9 family peptidase [Aquimonas voraii]|uniref:Dipeptidyl aminopeptidase/acylaminoacyl peptidase n=1 Tax=Aquimonas voraii TaxID=265719 RepID=A0A1G6UAU7_9GAMM|nr:prolyl oligopeptidase family serine peptidase [Aquimonas voraii]SDD37717.1 Dipeptidyl aminopeptidase/acylaminoacyl peptidase [Aquimonas voraii]